MSAREGAAPRRRDAAAAGHFGTPRHVNVAPPAGAPLPGPGLRPTPRHPAPERSGRGGPRSDDTRAGKAPGWEELRGQRAVENRIKICFPPTGDVLSTGSSRAARLTTERAPGPRGPAAVPARPAVDSPTPRRRAPGATRRQGRPRSEGSARLPSALQAGGCPAGAKAGDRARSLATRRACAAVSGQPAGPCRGQGPDPRPSPRETGRAGSGPRPRRPGARQPGVWPASPPTGA